jgi:hypothetical protein
MSRSSRRFAALVGAAAILLSACASRDVHGKDATNVVKDAGGTEEQAKCIGDGVDDQLSQKERNEVGGAEKLSDLDKDLEATVQGIIDDCINGEGSSGSNDSSESDSSDTTDTTAEGDTTTTSAPG